MQQVTTPPEGVTIERVTTAETTPKTAEISARVGSESGRVLDARLLAQGETVRLRAERIWCRSARRPTSRSRSTASRPTSPLARCRSSCRRTPRRPRTNPLSRLRRGGAGRAQLPQRSVDRPLRGTAIRALDRAGEPHEGLCETEAGHRLSKWINAGGTIATAPQSRSKGMRRHAARARCRQELTQSLPRFRLGCSYDGDMKRGVFNEYRGGLRMRKLLLLAVAGLALATAAPALAANPTTSGSATITNNVGTIVSNTSVANSPPTMAARSRSRSRPA